MPPRNYRNAPRRSRLPRLLIGGLGILTMMTVGIVGTLWLAGVPLNPFARTDKEDPYLVRIPINAQPIPAYTRVDRSQMINPATGGLMYQMVPPASAVGMSIVGVDQNGSHAEGRVENVKRLKDEVVFVLADNREVRHSQAFKLGGAMLNINSIIGRVVKRDKRAGLGFQESTFFPEGTPEGIAGATPVGMRAITLDATKLTGIHALGAGDQIDLLASFPVDASSADSGSLLIPGQSASSGKKGEASEPHMLAQKAVVLKPVYVRNEASTSASLTQGTRVQNIPKYEVAIAVNPDDLIPIQRALNQSLSITCIAHSMKPGGETHSIASVQDSDTIMVPVTVHPVLAYNVVTREAFVSAATRTLKVESMSRSQVAKMDVITALDEALGAVAKHDIPAGRFLRRSDLLNGPPGQVAPSQKISTQETPSGAANPFHNGHQFVSMVQQPTTEAAPAATAVGDRPAISRFVPSGMQSFSIPWNRVYGGEHLQIGDSIDLMVSYPLQKLTKAVETSTSRDGTVTRREYETIDFRKTERNLEESFGNRGEPWFVASDAIVIGPVGFPAPAAALRALADPNDPTRGRGADDRSGVKLSGPAIIIAVADQDAENFAAALVTNEALFSVAIHSTSVLRSGMKEIALSPVGIQAYERFDEAVWNNNRRRIMTRLVDESDPRFALAIGSKEIESYYGRTLANAKSRWDFFCHDDFLPPEFRPGVAAAVRPGYTVALIDESFVEGLAAFQTEELVTIILRSVTTLPSHILYHRFNRDFPQAIVVVRNIRIIRRSVQGKVAIELPDCESAALQSALAFVKPVEKKDNVQQKTTIDGSNHPTLVAVAQPRFTSVDNGNINPPFSAVESFDSLGSICLMELIVGTNRTIYAFDAKPPITMEYVQCE